MLSTAVRQLRRPLLGALHNGKQDIGEYLKLTPTLHNTTIARCQYGIIPRQMSFIEEDTLSSKVLYYMRSQHENEINFRTCENLEHDVKLYGSQIIHQMLLVIVHSTELKASDVIRTFSLYNLQKNSILKDVIAKKSLMQDVRRKVEQILPTMTLDQLKNFAQILKELQFKKSNYLMKIVSDISHECERRAYDGDIKQCLELFDILVMLHGSHVCKRNQYDVFMSLFEREIQSAEPVDLVHILHYIGLGKKKKLNQEFVVSAVKQLSKHVDDLAFVDVGIAATGIFKTCVKLDKNSIFLQKVVERLSNVLKNCSGMNDLESYAFVGMIKLIRAARYEGKHFLPSVSAFVMQANMDVLTPEVIAHILALYTNMSVYHPQVFTRMEGLILQYLSAPLQLVRIKDLARVLWALSHVRHICSKEFLEVCDKCITEFVQNCGVNTYPEFLAGSLLSMAIMDHYPENLIKEAFEPQKITAVSKGYQRSKLLSRLLMLHKAVSVEHPELSVAFPRVPQKDLPTRTYADEMHYRPALATLMEGAQVLNEMLDSPVFMLNFTIPHFNFASLVINDSVLKDVVSAGKSNSYGHSHVVKQLCSVSERYSGSQLALELFDTNCTVQDTLQPIGMVELKIRLMKQCGWIVKMVTEADISRCEGDVQAVAAVILDALDKQSL